MIIDEMQHSEEENRVHKAERTVDRLEYCIREILNMGINTGVAWLRSLVGLNNII